MAENLPGLAAALEFGGRRDRCRLWAGRAGREDLRGGRSRRRGIPAPRSGRGPPAHGGGGQSAGGQGGTGYPAPGWRRHRRRDRHADDVDAGRAPVLGPRRRRLHRLFRRRDGRGHDLRGPGDGAGIGARGHVPIPGRQRQEARQRACRGPRRRRSGHPQGARTGPSQARQTSLERPVRRRHRARREGFRGLAQAPRFDPPRPLPQGLPGGAVLFLRRRWPGQGRRRPPRQPGVGRELSRYRRKRRQSLLWRRHRRRHRRHGE